MHPEDIKACLRKRGITLRDLAFELNVTPSAITHVIRRDTKSKRIEALIAEKLELEPAQVWAGSQAGSVNAL
jgi:lambda repressor-like predicted transcriptional regulator